jgi:hypothetical protein
MHRSGDTRQWWVLVIVALLVVFMWPPDESKSLAAKFVNWAVDPMEELPVMPPPLSFANGDDPVAVTEHDSQAQYYDFLYRKGGWIRRRLELKVADDPFDRSTERQLLIALGVATVFVVWRFARKN